MRGMRKHRKVRKISRLFSKEQHPVKSGGLLPVIMLIVHHAVSIPLSATISAYYVSGYRRPTQY
jgi:hypothetical protein